MTDPSTPIGSDFKGQLDREAAKWCMRLHGEEAPRWQPEFDAWLKRGALHREAYNKVEEVYLLGARARWPEGDRPPQSPPLPVAMQRRSPTVAWLLAGVGAALIGVVSLRSLLPTARPLPGASSETPVELSASPGAAQDFTLRDGSRVGLLAASALQVSFTPKERRLRLLRGEGRFAVVHEGRPFIVEAGGGTVTATGTEFEIGLETGRRTVAVHVIEGLVDVVPPESMRPGPAPHRLRAGDRLRYAALFTAPASSGQSAPAWETVQPRTVGDLVAAANALPGARLRIEVADPALLALRLGGIFRVHDAEAVAGRLAALLDLEVDRTHPHFLLLRRRPAPGG